LTRRQPCRELTYILQVRRPLRPWIWIGVVVLTATLGVAGQTPEALPSSLTQMIEAERAFAARALVIGWKQAFLEFFSLGAIGFEGGQAGPARDQIAKNPDPPKDLQLIWEPRYGDVSANGEIGYLTGPVQNIRASRDGGKPRHSNYASIWKRQRDGSFKVVMDVGIQTPSAVPFPRGFTRAPHKNRFTGDYDDSTPPLGTADEVLNSALRTSQARAYRPHLAEGTRFHRPNRLPVVGQQAVTQWLASQPAISSADSKYAEAARSGDLGYTWGTYTIAPRRTVTARSGNSAAQTINVEAGFYVRVWVRERDGQWKVALDVLQ
jgi:ketosteroid isomerase-like protein